MIPWQDRVSDFGLLVLGVALPCAIAGYFWVEEPAESVGAAEVAGAEQAAAGPAAPEGAAEVTGAEPAAAVSAAPPPAAERARAESTTARPAAPLTAAGPAASELAAAMHPAPLTAAEYARAEPTTARPVAPLTAAGPAASELAAAMHPAPLTAAEYARAEPAAARPAAPLTAAGPAAAEPVAAMHPAPLTAAEHARAEPAAARPAAPLTAAGPAAAEPVAAMHPAPLTAAEHARAEPAAARPAAPPPAAERDRAEPAATMSAALPPAAEHDRAESTTARPAAPLPAAEPQPRDDVAESSASARLGAPGASSAERDRSATSDAERLVRQAAESAQPRAASSEHAAARLAVRAATLLSPDAGLRAETVHALTHLDNDWRTAIIARLAQLASQRPPPHEVAGMFAFLRSASDTTPAGEQVDLAFAAPTLLERTRTPQALAVVEPLLYLRSLETMVGAEGQPDLALFVELDAGAWEAELRLSAKRLGASFVPALIHLRAHENPRVRRFAASQLTAIGADDPKRVLNGGDPSTLARAIRAYASPPDYAAMPVIVRLLGDGRIQVREAARAAVHRFGKNAIWQLRELYEEVSGQPADKRWNYERAARELYAVLDRPRVEEAETLLARGLQALTRGDLDTMRNDYDALLAKYPDFEHRDRLAEGYAALAADLFRRDSLAPALAAYRRALRLAPAAPAAKHWRARTAFVSAELSLTRGVVDLTGYTRALALDPQLREARDAIERLSGTRTQHVRDMKRLAALAALALLLTCVVLLLRRAPADRAPDPVTASPPIETKSELSS